METDVKSYKEPVLVQEQIPNSPNYKKMLFVIMGGALLVIILLAIGFLLRQKGFADNKGNYDPYAVLRSSHPKIEAKTFSDNSIDFVLHSDKPDEKLTVPVTVTLKTEPGSNLKSAIGANGHVLKAWVCGVNLFCVDVDAYENIIHVQ